LTQRRTLAGVSEVLNEGAMTPLWFSSEAGPGFAASQGADESTPTRRGLNIAGSISILDVVPEAAVEQGPPAVLLSVTSNGKGTRNVASNTNSAPQLL
jgi:hypothetical protein